MQISHWTDLLGLKGVISLLLLGQVPLVSTHQISCDLVVSTTKGKIRGFETSVPHNPRKLSAWYGIPYAQPPLGKLRFQHPRPMNPWEGVMDTKEKPNSCVQVENDMFPGFPGTEQWNPNTQLSEDCLYLNVVVPQPYPEDAAVMVWIHGGGFMSGTSTLDLYDMRTFAAEQNIIMVSIQYRLASLGFLFLDTEDVPGNAGMFDQVMALQWVQYNIAKFGGNPNNITLVGESAGAASVSLHLLSPMSRNYFSQAIMQSASALAPWAVISKEEAYLRGLRLAELMKCPTDRNDVHSTIECLRSANATDLVYNEKERIVLGLDIGIFVPIIDGAFLDEKPATSLQNMNFKKTNILLGSNQDEGIFHIFHYLPELFEKKGGVWIDQKDFKRAIEDLNVYENRIQRRAIEYEYTNWLNPEDPWKNRIQVDRLTGDKQFTCSVVDFAHRYAETDNRVHMYYFNQVSSVSPWPKWSGALQGDEIHFVFGQPLNQTYHYSENEIKFSKDMMTYWANFAKTSHPSLNSSNMWTDEYWPQHTPYRREIMLLNAEKTEILQGNKEKKCAFWNKFLPELAMPYVPERLPCDESCCETGQANSSAVPFG